jgi:hypothetical protein
VAFTRPVPLRFALGGPPRPQGRGEVCNLPFPPVSPIARPIWRRSPLEEGRSFILSGDYNVENRNDQGCRAQPGW